MATVKVLIAQQCDKSGFKVLRVYTDPDRATKDCDLLREASEDKDYLLFDCELIENKT